MGQQAEGLVTIPADGVELEGALAIPEGAGGIVVFAHGSGSSRHSPRNNYVAETLQERGLATLLFDLLTEEEDRDRATRFDVSLLTERLLAATAWLERNESTAGSRIGYFGSSTGAAAALRAAANRETGVDAVVSRGGRVDMASEVIGRVTAPTRLIVGGEDRAVLDLNRDVREALAGEADLVIVEGAGHLFKEPGELEAVADRAGEWFDEHLQ